MSAGERRAWDRRPGETSRGYAAFRAFRDRGPLRQLSIDGSRPSNSVRRWSQDFDWAARAVAWDDECSMLDDRRRLDAIRAMHGEHVEAGRAAVAIALRALENLDPEKLTASEAARLLALGTQLERSTLTSSIDELQRMASGPPVLDGTPTDDAFDVIARELGSP